MDLASSSASSLFKDDLYRRRSGRLLLKNSDAPISEIDSKAGILWSTINYIGLEERNNKRKMDFPIDEKVKRPKIDKSNENDNTGRKDNFELDSVNKQDEIKNSENKQKRKSKNNQDSRFVSTELKNLNQRTHSKYLRTGYRSGVTKSEGAKWREFMKEGLHNQEVIKKRRKITKTTQNNLNIKQSIAECSTKEEVLGYLTKCLFESAMIPPATLKYKFQLNSYLKEREAIRNLLNDRLVISNMENMKYSLMKTFKENPGVTFHENEKKIANYIVKCFNKYTLVIVLDAICNETDSTPVLGQKLTQSSHLTTSLHQFLKESPKELYGNSKILSRNIKNAGASLLYRSMFLIYLMENVKIKRILKTDPPLFCKTSKFKRSVQIMMELRDLMFTFGNTKSHGLLKDRITELIYYYFHYRQITTYEYHDSLITTYNSLFSTTRLEEYVRITKGKVLKIQPLKKYNKTDGGFKNLQRNSASLKDCGFSLKFTFDQSSSLKFNNLNLLWETVSCNLPKGRYFKTISLAVVFCIFINRLKKKEYEISKPSHQNYVQLNSPCNSCSEVILQKAGINNNSKIDIVEVVTEDSIVDVAKDNKLPTYYVDSEDEGNLVMNHQLQHPEVNYHSRVSDDTSRIEKPEFRILNNRNQENNDNVHCLDETIQSKDCPLDLSFKNKEWEECLDKDETSIQSPESCNCSEIYRKSPTPDIGFQIHRIDDRSNETEEVISKHSSFDDVLPSNDSCYASIEPLSHESVVEKQHETEPYVEDFSDQLQGSEKLNSINNIESTLGDNQNSKSEVFISNDYEIDVVDIKSFSNKSDFANSMENQNSKAMNGTTNDSEIIKNKDYYGNSTSKPTNVTDCYNVSIVHRENGGKLKADRHDQKLPDTDRPTIQDDKAKINEEITVEQAHNQAGYLNKGNEKSAEEVDEIVVKNDNYIFYPNELIIHEDNKTKEKTNHQFMLQTDDEEPLKATAKGFTTTNYEQADLIEIISKKSSGDVDSIIVTEIPGFGDKSCKDDESDQKINVRKEISDKYEISTEEIKTSLSMSSSDEKGQTTLNEETCSNKPRQGESSIPSCKESINSPDGNDVSLSNQKNQTRNSSSTLSKDELDIASSSIQNQCDKLEVNEENNVMLQKEVSIHSKRPQQNKSREREAHVEGSRCKPFDFIKTSLSLGSGYDGLPGNEAADSSWLSEINSCNEFKTNGLSTSAKTSLCPTTAFHPAGLDSRITGFPVQALRPNHQMEMAPNFRGFWHYDDSSNSRGFESQHGSNERMDSFRLAYPNDWRGFMGPRNLSSQTDYSRRWSNKHQTLAPGQSYSHDRLTSPCYPSPHPSMPRHYPTTPSYPPNSSYYPSFYEPCGVPSPNLSMNTYNIYIDNRSYISPSPNSLLPQPGDFPSTPKFRPNMNLYPERRYDPQVHCSYSNPINMTTTSSEITSNSFDSKMLSSCMKTKVLSEEKVRQKDSLTFNDNVQHSSAQSAHGISSPEIMEVLNTFLDTDSTAVQPISQIPITDLSVHRTPPSLRSIHEKYLTTDTQNFILNKDPSNSTHYPSSIPISNTPNRPHSSNELPCNQGENESLLERASLRHSYYDNNEESRKLSQADLEYTSDFLKISLLSYDYNMKSNWK